jgi:Nickel/cobalt transporter regulator
MILKISNEQAKGATMLRKIVLAAMLALALPTVVMAQREEHPPRGRPGPGEFRGPHPGGPRGPGAFRGPGPAPGRFLYHGRPFNRVHIAPFVYPPGWAYRRWAIGAVLPPLFLAPAYYYSNWAALGLPPPQPGFQWVRYGPDVLLVNVTTGQVVDTVYGAFY